MNKLLYVVIGILAVIALVLVFRSPVSLTGTSPGISADYASSTQFALTAGTVARIIATSTNCASRTITTSAAGIGLSFSDAQGDLLTGNLGEWQGASTTVIYDSATKGCGVIRVRGTAVGTITLTENK